MLYICATPIGNLDDISMRCLRILKEADVIAAEDTRHSLKLLNYFNIKTPLTSYHQHNKAEKGAKIIEMLKSGKNVALITDAGTPAISDPGEDLVRLCHLNNILVCAIPGACALIAALCASGLNTSSFVFEGFLNNSRSERLLELVGERRTIIFYEAPHHLLKTLKVILEILGNRKMSISRELTKKYEETFNCTVSEAIAKYENQDIHGEFVLVVEGAKEEVKDWVNLSVNEHVEYYVKLGFSKMEAMKAVAKERKVSKSVIYNELSKKA